jgi:hypothetical protein
LNGVLGVEYPISLSPDLQSKAAELAPPLHLPGYSFLMGADEL